ncbi:MAG TPA: TIGR04255 family protein [Thermoanaerobaculia bacterium]|nr:TIGR04255 family protein [Thermoanaerobaculia bacterium]
MTSEGKAAAALAAETPAPMLFPDSPRVLYSRNPLIDVISQLRFPPILRIDSEVPAGFQERIREDFPLLSEEDPSLFADLPPEFTQFMKAGLSSQAKRNVWKFESEDTNWAVTLTREFVALQTKEYNQWEEFRVRLRGVLDALQAEYRPSFLTRIGLRYQDLIVRSTLGLTDLPWSDLLQPHVAAEFSSPSLRTAVREAAHRVLIELSHQKGNVNLQHGTARRQGDKEISYLIDNDFFTEEKMEVANALERLDLFNREAGRLFRWCISDRLHAAMEPTPIAT